MQIDNLVRPWAHKSALPSRGLAEGSSSRATALQSSRRCLSEVFRSAVGALRAGRPLPTGDVIPAADREALRDSGRNGLWVTVELAPFAVAGGLGQVSETAPEVLNQYLGKDVRVMMPHLRPLKNSGLDFDRTGVTTTLTGFDGTAETFELLQCARPGKPVLYTIENEKYFGSQDLLYTPRDKAVPGIGEDALFKSVMMYNRAASAFIPALDGDKQAAQRAALPTARPAAPQSEASRPSGKPVGETEGRGRVRELFARAVARLMPSLNKTEKAGCDEQPAAPSVERFDGKLDFLIAHDWLTSPMFNELDPQHAEGLGKIFFLHNTYDEARDLDYACRVNGLKAPCAGATTYSPLRIGLEKADAVIGNAFYVERLTSGLVGDSAFVGALQAQRDAGRVFDMHHGLSDQYSPRDNPNLRENGYTDLPAGFGTHAARDLPALDGFKQRNRLAMQREMGLTQDADAVVFSWIARPEPYQKGFTMLMDQLGDFLRQNPKAQAVVAGINLEKAPADVQAWVETLRQDPQLQGRVSFPGFVDNQKVVRLAAGSSFLVLPSTYEPYGLSQLEAMRVGALPIVHAVDGLRATVADPGKGLETPAALQPYGRTGVFMQPFDVPAFWNALDARTKGQGPDAAQQAVLDNASRKLRNALDEAMALDTHTPAEATQARWNAMRYVEEQHSWKKISARYVAPIGAAKAAARERSLLGTRVSITA
ncbi:MAG: glycosyltransferase [Proteobacteria bacterium]|nr:glycosyltransferase [Pseudomonadota bacterium]